MSPQDPTNRPPLSQSNRELFDDIRDTLYGREHKVDRVQRDEKLTAIDEIVTEHFPGQNAEAEEITVEVAENSAPETTTSAGGGARGGGGGGGGRAGGTWRTAEAPAAPVAPATQNPPMQVGLMVWAGILIIMALMILLQLFFSISSGPLLLATLMAVFGVILVGVGLTSNRRPASSQ